MRILICEPEFHTHYHFIQYLLPKLCEIGDEVQVAVMSNAESDPHYQNTIAPLEYLNRLTVLKLFEPMPEIEDRQEREDQEDLARERNFLLMLDLLRQKAVDHVIVLSADKLVPLFVKYKNSGGFLSSYPAELHLGLHWLMPEAFPRLPAESSLTGLGSSIGAKELRHESAPLNAHQQQMHELVMLHPATVFFQNLLAYRRFCQLCPELDAATYFNPVPIEVFEPLGKEEARLLLGLPAEGKIIGFTGSIQFRKGIRKFLNAIKEADLEPGTCVALIGPFDDFEVAGMIQREFKDLLARGVLLVHDQVLDASELHMVISAFDVLVCNITRHRWASDMALRAVVAERPILAADHDWFGFMIRSYGMGYLAPEATQELSAIIPKILEQSGHYSLKQSASAVRDFNHPDHYAQVVTDAIFNKEGTRKVGGYELD